MSLMRDETCAQRLAHPKRDVRDAQIVFFIEKRAARVDAWLHTPGLRQVVLVKLGFG